MRATCPHLSLLELISLIFGEEYKLQIFYGLLRTVDLFSIYCSVFPLCHVTPVRIYSFNRILTKLNDT